MYRQVLEPIAESSALSALTGAAFGLSIAIVFAALSVHQLTVVRGRLDDAMRGPRETRGGRPVVVGSRPVVTGSAIPPNPSVGRRLTFSDHRFVNGPSLLTMPTIIVPTSRDGEESS